MIPPISVTPVVVVLPPNPALIWVMVTEGSCEWTRSSNEPGPGLAVSEVIESPKNTHSSLIAVAATARVGGRATPGTSQAAAKATTNTTTAEHRPSLVVLILIPRPKPWLMCGTIQRSILRNPRPPRLALRSALEPRRGPRHSAGRERDVRVDDGLSSVYSVMP